MNHSSDAYSLIWETVSRIPKGKVSTYGEIAKRAGLAGQARLVGYAMHNIPPGSDIPWHRVINVQGKISFPQGSNSYQRQRTLLVSEGIKFIHDRIDLEKYGWENSSRWKQNRVRK